MADVIVLGAGMVGTASALALQARGLDVVLADRRAPGRETSYGNAGIIQGEAMEPYALPTNPLALLRLGLGAENAVRWTPAGVLGQAGALLRYLGQSRPARHAAISAIYAQLIARAVPDHEPLVAAAGAGNLMRPRGFRQGWRSARAFDAARADAERQVRTWGIEIEVMDGAALARAEPGLRTPYAGAIDWRDCWACADPGALVAAYAALFERQGGSLARADASTLTRAGTGWRVTGETGPIQAARVVLALGPWTPAALKPFGARVPMVGKRGYHLHFKGERTLNLPFMDTEVSAVMSPMRDGLARGHGGGTGADGRAGEPQPADQGRGPRTRDVRAGRGGRGRTVVRHAPLSARHAAGAGRGPGSARSLGAFRPWPSGFHPRPRYGRKSWPAAMAGEQQRDDRRAGSAPRPGLRHFRPGR